jgi:hypothetical protein
MPSTVFFLVGAVGIGLTIVDGWRLRRHLARNDSGQCAHCGRTLASWRTRQVRHGAPFRRSGTLIEVCLDCFARYRRGRILLYGVLPPLVVMLLIALMHRQI